MKASQTKFIIVYPVKQKSAFLKSLNNLQREVSSENTHTQMNWVNKDLDYTSLQKRAELQLR